MWNLFVLSAGASNLPTLEESINSSFEICNHKHFIQIDKNMHGNTARDDIWKSVGYNSSYKPVT